MLNVFLAYSNSSKNELRRLAKTGFKSRKMSAKKLGVSSRKGREGKLINPLI
jgi:hypothetical protein